MDLAGWRAGSQESVLAKALSGSSDPLNAEENGTGKKSNHSSPEKRKVHQVQSMQASMECSHAD